MVKHSGKPGKGITGQTTSEKLGRCASLGAAALDHGGIVAADALGVLRLAGLFAVGEGVDERGSCPIGLLVERSTRGFNGTGI